METEAEVKEIAIDLSSEPLWRLFSGPEMLILSWDIFFGAQAALAKIYTALSKLLKPKWTFLAQHIQIAPSS